MAHHRITGRHGAVLLAALLASAAPAAAQRRNLGPAINSQWNEIIPIISADGRTLYFDRKNYPLNAGGVNDHDDIWFSHLQPDSTWSRAENLATLNTKSPNAIFSILPDNNTALYWGAIDSAGRLTFALVHRTADGWSNPQQLRIADFYNRSTGITACLAPDGRTLLMALRRDDSPGSMNIYVSFLEDEEANAWSAPKSLGPAINTVFGETTPMVGADGETLFFSSARPGGYGAIDIYVARRLDSTWTTWSPPEDLGPDFNIPGENYLNSITASGEYAFLSGQVENPTKNLDIFRIRMPERFRTRPVVLLTGHVREARADGGADSTRPLDARIVYERLRDGKRLGIARTDPRTGGFKIALPGSEAYGFRIESDRHLPVSDHVDLRALTSYREVTRDYALPPIATGSTVQLNNIFFDFARADLRPESDAELDRIAALLRDKPSMVVSIEGHTDDVGGDEQNDALSLARANAVRAYLASQGIDANRMLVKGYGKRRPVASNTSDEGRSRNRRVVFRIVRM